MINSIKPCYQSKCFGFRCFIIVFINLVTSAKSPKSNLVVSINKTTHVPILTNVGKFENHNLACTFELHGSLL